MKIMIIGSTQYVYHMYDHKDKLEMEGHAVRLPFLDHDIENELVICMENIESIRWCEEVHLFWSQRTLGTLLDIGATMALNKPLKIIYLEPKTITNALRMYADNLNKPEMPDR